MWTHWVRTLFLRDDCGISDQGPAPMNTFLQFCPEAPSGDFPLSKVPHTRISHVSTKQTVGTLMGSPGPELQLLNSTKTKGFFYFVFCF